MHVTNMAAPLVGGLGVVIAGGKPEFRMFASEVRQWVMHYLRVVIL